MRAFALRQRPRLSGFGVAPQLLLVALCLGLAVAMMATPVRQLLDQRQRMDAMAQELARVQERNAALQERVARLNDPDYLEQRARAQSGLVRPGEIAWIVMPPGRGAEKRARARRAEQPPPPPPPGFAERLRAFLGLP